MTLPLRQRNGRASADCFAAHPKIPMLPLKASARRSQMDSDQHHHPARLVKACVNGMDWLFGPSARPISPPGEDTRAFSTPSSNQIRHAAMLPRSRDNARKAVLSLPSREASVTDARHFTAHLLRHWGIAEDERQSAVLVASELAANAAQHGHADMALLLILDEDVLELAFADSGATVAHQEAHADLPPDEHGHGMAIVKHLALWVDVHDSRQGRKVRVGLRVQCPLS
jgi:anti-sigma regulatory factor (Ser/Thr protein kinase)